MHNRACLTAEPAQYRFRVRQKSTYENGKRHATEKVMEEIELLDLNRKIQRLMAMKIGRRCEISDGRTVDHGAGWRLLFVRSKGHDG